jgi:hypothetical protein
VTNINATTIIAIVFAIVLLVGIAKFDMLKAGLSALGAKLTLQGRNRDKPSPSGGGIRGNTFFGSVKVTTKGKGRVDENRAAGAIEIEADDSNPEPTPTPKPKK